MIDKSAAGNRIVITGAMLRFIRSTIARKTSGVNVYMDRLIAAHGPWNIPATKAEETMLISCQVFIANAPFSSICLRSQTPSFSMSSSLGRVNFAFELNRNQQ